MDPLALAVLAFVVLFVALALLSARANAGRPLSEFGQRQQARPEPVAASQLELQDLSEMLEITNARRRARGLPERTLSDALREFGDE